MRAILLVLVLAAFACGGNDKPPPAPVGCAGDLNRDGVVSIADHGVAKQHLADVEAHLGETCE